jgi:hypothetical protein
MHQFTSNGALVCIVITWIFQHRPSFAALLILAALYLLTAARPRRRSR